MRLKLFLSLFLFVSTLHATPESMSQSTGQKQQDYFDDCMKELSPFSNSEYINKQELCKEFKNQYSVQCLKYIQATTTDFDIKACSYTNTQLALSCIKVIAEGPSVRVPGRIYNAHSSQIISCQGVRQQSTLSCVKKNVESWGSNSP